MVNATHSEVDPIEGAGDYERYDRIWQRIAPDETRKATGQMPPLVQNGTEGAELLPGTEPDPCCMGTDAREMIRVLEGFAREEAENSAAALQIAKYAPNRMSAAALQELSRMAAHRAKELYAICFLITGEAGRMPVASVVLPRISYRDLLRNSYHGAVCNALNYARAEDATPDPCLQRILQRFSEESYRASDRILRLLSQGR